jgi:uncharacterized OsmC-like protein
MSLVNKVRSYTTGIPGRSLNQVGPHHFVIDGAARSGGPAEELAPGDAFLSGVSGCGVLLVERTAAEEGVRVGRIEATIEGIRDEADPSWFQVVRLHFMLEGVDQATAERLVAVYQRKCPLYRTVAAATTVEVKVSTLEHVPVG